MIQNRMLKAFRVAASALATILLLAGAGGIHAADDQGEQSVAIHNGHEIVPGEVLVKYRDPTIAGEAALEMDADRDEGIDGKATRRVHSRRYDTATLLAILAKRTDVEYAEPNYIVHALQTVTAPNDIYYGLEWGLNNTGSPGADIHATTAWQTTTGSRQNMVAVIDTGIDYNHEDLQGNVWSAPVDFTVTVGGKPITCAAGTHGFNAITKSCDPMDDNGHGTHISGTIGAVANTLGVVGVNWTASIIGVKFLDATGSGSIADAITAIEFAIQMKQQLGINIRVLSNSWGGGGSSKMLLQAIQHANTNDMLFVAAAGNASSDNDKTPSYPASYGATPFNVPNVVAVAATDSKDRLASFSNYGANSVALGAPGVNIYSTMPMGNMYFPKQLYGYLSGTSMATPHVSGVAALVLAACPNLNVTSLMSAILNTDPISSLAGKTSSGGRLNAANAINYAVTNCAATTPPPSTPPTPTPAPAPPAADFTISASPVSTSVKHGRSVNITMTMVWKVSNPGTVDFAVTGLPSGASVKFNPMTVKGSGKSTMTVTTINSTQPGTSLLTITGISGPLSHPATVSLRVR